MLTFKANIKITLRKGILDVQGKAVEKALLSMGYDTMENVRIGKYITLNIKAENESLALEYTNKACNEFIANPIIEDYEVSLEKID
ncbi:MAG TPA: phosphoribosylformylglycinamidine synthase subunit PurS [Candidatus Kapabacteria bacterium]|nr:phosphoribosylformylglycinamidine synthase subunit PurS [Candidatus Kapabacteria bacterium]